MCEREKWQDKTLEGNGKPFISPLIIVGKCDRARKGEKEEDRNKVAHSLELLSLSM